MVHLDLPTAQTRQEPDSSPHLQVSGQEAVSYYVQTFRDGKTHWEHRGARKVFFKVKVGRQTAQEAALWDTGGGGAVAAVARRPQDSFRGH
jgi:hypothetical protein